MAHLDSASTAFGTLLGYAPGGVAAYSSDYETASKLQYPKRSAFRSHYDGIYMGYKWQCVEFARRYMYINHGYIFDDVAMAYDIFDLRTVRDVKENQLLPLNAFVNGNKRHPEVGCLLIWKEGGEFEETGHVAIVTEVTEQFVRIAEQNVGHALWSEGANYARQLKAKVTKEGEYWITCSYGDAQILGWMIQTDDNEYAEPHNEKNTALFQLHSNHANEITDAKKSWLNIANEDEAAFVDAMGGHYLTSVISEQTRYFIASQSAETALEYATNELHNMFMHATDYVLEHPELLEKFNLPNSVLPKIRQSWDNRLNQLITSRFDFAMTKNGLKVYEYNCDSASCYMESGKVQGKWARHYGINEGHDAGKDLFKDVARAWKKSHAKGVVHILRDDEAEEAYHALFMQDALKSAGIDSKIIIGLTGLQWSEQGAVIDAEGEQVKWVWKTWSWETALDQIRSECDEETLNTGVYEPDWQRNQPLRLSDVLLRENIMVFEPLWSLIPSNKAILPVLWSLFPNHPLLLNSAFELTPELQATGYVKKPIVGRCGANIELIDHNDTVVEATQGSFASQDMIYQQLFALPNIDGYFTQVCTFTAAGSYAGSGIRADKSMVINKDSDCFALRFYSDKTFLTEF
ncbi:bifunctional glutathionylspermidine amidase/synthase [Pseudoalteromonas tunicata]|uniref:bifunctional glutathionylspermidine amidase/synthase n=1 Tax=Pseudoalteromonas tunicata TaxID=314281 RepID=UPI00273E95A5|nr:bifunctional glutathionylspermidine amidase/synthase [Pseudoalteromonas tunicata]MDP4984956.1 bifunctional glutathionylspermidine amidase/synthase [Pseudoalteromonas tunicata]